MTNAPILLVNSSARFQESQSRALSREIVDNLIAANPYRQVITRELGHGIEQIDEAWVNANFTPDEARTPEHKTRLAFSDTLVAELEAAETVVIGVPMYNFGIPSVLKAWIDLVARARRTFKYTENGPVGLLTGKRAVVVVTSGGTPIRSEIDFATNYMRHVLGFVGITDVTVVEAGPLMVDAEAALGRAKAAIQEIA